MNVVSLTELAQEQLAKAADASNGRSAVTIYGGHEHHLRQTLIAIRAGEKLADHANPGEATLQVLVGQVTVRSGSNETVLQMGEYLVIPDAVHSVHAEEDSAVLLSVSVRRR
ncbi:LuxR family transcriptional regulator [Scrofimicrobium sp. R131]|uniref:LuxR family transcriptional regulator n=1 Tax=Scrofimicrobium appendicitidis TaxID=3079930 RepID=A0AAU7V524_9ACTO